jgi:hypothetical protein
MGILAVIDTFFDMLYIIELLQQECCTDCCYLFAVMPLTWYLGRILFDPIQLPLLLTSVLLAICTKDFNVRSYKIVTLTLLSGLGIKNSN